MRIRVDLDQETTGRLMTAAVSERRTVMMQAEVIIRRGLGLPVPVPPRPTPAERTASDPGMAGTEVSDGVAAAN